MSETEILYFSSILFLDFLRIRLENGHTFDTFTFYDISQIVDELTISPS